MKIFLLTWLTAGLAAAASPAALLDKSQTIIPSAPFNGDIQAKFTSTGFGLDGPMLSAVNSTSLDWWYFDVVSTDLKRSLVIVFYTALPSAFPFLLDSEIVLKVGIYATYLNGTTVTVYLDGDEAVISTQGQGSSGNFVGSGASWNGAPDLSSYDISINAPSKGVVGTFNLTSNAPAHYPCGPAVAGQTMEQAPHIGWSNAMPDADGHAEITIDGDRLVFHGVAYHDKNWSDQPFPENVNSWYWGHARLGPYALVWFDYLATDNTRHVSSYIAHNGAILSSSCTADSVIVRPYGANSAYPPHSSTGPPDGFHVDFTLTDGRVFNVTVAAQELIANGHDLYYRWTGNVTGQFDGGRRITRGEAVMEQFALTG